MADFICNHCRGWYRKERNLKWHVTSSHMNQPLFSQCERSFNRSNNLHMHMHTCTRRGVPTVTVPAVKKGFTGVSRKRLQCKLQKTREALKCSVHQFTVNMKEAKSLSTLEKTISVFQPVMMDFQQEHSA